MAVGDIVSFTGSVAYGASVSFKVPFRCKLVAAAYKGWLELKIGVGGNAAVTLANIGGLSNNSCQGICYLNEGDEVIISNTDQKLSASINYFIEFIKY